MWKNCTAFSIKYQNHHLKAPKHEITAFTWYLLVIENVLLHDVYYCKQKSWTSKKHTYLKSSFDSILIVFYNIIVFSVIFNSSLIIYNVLDIQSFFSILAFHINDIHHDFSSCSFDGAHFLNNTQLKWR